MFMSSRGLQLLRVLRSVASRRAPRGGQGISGAVQRRLESESSASHPIYRPDIDGLRAVAVLAVVCYHAAPSLLPGGFAGVDVFFVISGFLISGILLRSLAQGSFSCIGFYARRVKRIFPALIAMLAGTWALGWAVLLSDEYQVLGKHMMAGAGFMMNLSLFADTKKYFGAISTPLIHLWSLGVEEQFYLLWPLFLWGIWNLGKGRVGPIVGIAALSFAFNAVAITYEPLASFYLPWSRLWELSAGGMLAHLQLNEAQKLARMRALISARWPQALKLLAPGVRGAIGAVALLGSFAGLDAALAFPGWWALAPSAGALLLISAGPQAWVNRHVLSRPLIVYIGLISYPLYLWHWPLLSFAHSADWREFTPATRAAAVATSFALAALTYRYIESPIRRSANTTELARLLCVAMAGCAAIGYTVFTQGMPARFESPEVARFVRAATEKVPYPDDDGVLTLGEASQRVLFIGDSTMAQYYPRVAKLLADHPLNSRSAVFAWRAGCASEPEMSLVDPASCRELLQSALEQANDPRVDTVVIGFCWYVYFTGIRDPDHVAEASPLLPATGRALDNLQALVAGLVQQRKRVFVMLQTPVDGGFAPRQMIRRSVLAPGFQLDIRPAARVDVDRRVAPFVSRLRRIAVATGAHVIDPMDYLCDAKACPAVAANGEPIYRNTFHLRESYVRESVHYLDQLVLDSQGGRDGAAAGL